MATLCVLTILAKLMRTCTEEEKFNAQRMVFALNKVHPTIRYGHTLLHLACCTTQPDPIFGTINSYKFPCAETANLLIRCGANVNAMDRVGNTPLHLIANYKNAHLDILTTQSIITNLIKNGAHVDMVNIIGDRALEAASTDVVRKMLKSQEKICLKCLAANAVKIHGIPYAGLVSPDLEKFIELHGLGVKRWDTINQIKRKYNLTPVSI